MENSDSWDAAKQYAILIIQYACLGGIIFAFWYYSSRRGGRAGRVPVRQEKQQPVAKREREQKPAGRKAPVKQSTPAGVTRPKEAPRAPSYAAVAAAAAARPIHYSSGDDDDDDDDVNNKEFARQLSSIKTGTNFAGSATSSTTARMDDRRHAKLLRQSQAQEATATMPAFTEDDMKTSAPSSTAGVDADDDQSPATTSPLVEAADVSDMLEKPLAGPSVLRLTNTEDKNNPNKRQQQSRSDSAEVETKKQRQNKKKAESAKAERHEAEEHRKVLMEAQRRLARISEGRPAKDGSAFMQSAATTTKQNAWAKPPHLDGGRSNGENQSAAAVRLLDTFEPTTDKAATADGRSSLAEESSWLESMPSEEDQLQMLRDEEAWSTVQPKSAKRGKKKDAKTDTDGESQPTATTQPPPTTATAAKAKAYDAKSTHRPKTINSQSSFAALSSDEIGAGEEKEWDV